MLIKLDGSFMEESKTKTLIMVMPKRNPIKIIFVTQTDGTIFQENGPIPVNKAIVTFSNQMKAKKMH
jgi:hypothetical protein